jgi:rhodanese-related sulfurtransferase
MRLAWVALAVAATSIVVADQAYPLRAKYPNLTPISTADLAQRIGSSVVIDVRSAFEFGVMHIDGAVHVDLTDQAFIEKLTKALGGDRSKSLVTYCNGTTCEKSYEAAAAAQKAGFTSVRVYDAGILEWARMARGRTLLFGKPVQPEEVISESRYQSHLAEPAAFEKGAGEPGSLLIDVRDALQRKNTADFARRAEWLTVDNFVRQLATPAFRARVEGKTIYVFDNVGKQVRWLQYALEANGFSRYVFLKDGMAGTVAGR